jgi:hypothetical protein
MRKSRELSHRVHREHGENEKGRERLIEADQVSAWKEACVSVGKGRKVGIHPKWFGGNDVDV